MYSISLLDILTLPILCFVWYIDCCVAIYTNLSCQFDNIDCENVHFYCENSFTYKKQQVLPHHSQEMLQFQQRTQMLWKILQNTQIFLLESKMNYNNNIDKTFSWFHNKNQQENVFIFSATLSTRKLLNLTRNFNYFVLLTKTSTKNFLSKCHFP